VFMYNALYIRGAPGAIGIYINVYAIMVECGSHSNMAKFSNLSKYGLARCT
jgi:hypothetical protein